jgi:hypothetical protein
MLPFFHKNFRRLFKGAVAKPQGKKEKGLALQANPL